jgi:hypothetical protein
MNTSQTNRSVSRRAALAGLGVGGVGVALGTTSRSAAAQDTAAGMAIHPIVGTWLEVSPGVSLTRFGADGAVITAWAANFADGEGNVVFQSPGVGVWEPVDDRSVRFSSVAIYSDAAGTFKATSTLDGYLTVSEDGQTFVDDWTHGTKFTDRDANNNVIGEFTGDGTLPPVTGVRVSVWDVPFPESSPSAATPTT